VSGAARHGTIQYSTPQHGAGFGVKAATRGAVPYRAEPGVVKEPTLRNVPTAYRLAEVEVRT